MFIIEVNKNDGVWYAEAFTAENAGGEGPNLAIGKGASIADALADVAAALGSIEGPEL